MSAILSMNMENLNMKASAEHDKKTQIPLLSEQAGCTVDDVITKTLSILCSLWLKKRMKSW
jgi:hypothetical protein